MSNLTQEWVPTEAEVPADHWSKSPEYLAEKAQYAQQPQKLTPESTEPAGSLRTPGTVKPFNKKMNTHKLAMSALEVPYVLTNEDIARLEKEKALKALADNKDLYEELAKNILANISGAVD